MTFSRSRGAQEKAVFMASHEGRVGEIKHQAPIHFRVEGEVEAIKGLVLVAEGGLLFSALEQAIAATIQFIGDEAGEEVEGRHGFGLRLVQASFQNRSHPAQAKLAKSTIELDHVHEFGSLIFCWMRSR